MGVSILKESFTEACIKNDCMQLIDSWDYDKNNISPDDVASQSNKKYWFKCQRGIHKSTAYYLYNITKYLNKDKEFCICKECASIGQFIVDQYGDQYLQETWSKLNQKSPFETYKGSSTRIFLKCIKDPTHPDYDLYAFKYSKTHGCPYCSGVRVCLTNSLGYKYPGVFDIWSDKNKDTPYDYTSGSGQYVWWICENGIHDDYRRRIDGSCIANFKCPTCARKNQRYLRGEDSPKWKGGITPQNKSIRASIEYSEWRKSVYERDGYICQICLNKSHNNLRAHHILSFANHEDLRFDVLNGITLCDQCHDISFPESFHTLYGTRDTTPSQLEEYANNRRKELGIDIPFNIDDYLYDHDVDINVNPDTGLRSLSAPYLK